jgi:hypothetical protein
LVTNTFRLIPGGAIATNGIDGESSNPLAFNDIFVRNGGSGGGSNFSGTGGNGGSGGLGAGGGGGGAGLIGGSGGRGGAGFAIIVAV